MDPVIIVGGGPTGLTLACLLARSGIRSTVLERFPEPYPLPRAVHMDAEVLRILSAVGVAGEFTAVSRPASGLRLVDRDLHVLAEFPRERSEERDGHPAASMYNQPDLEKILRARAARLPEITLVTGVELRDVLQSSSGVTATVTDLATGEPVVHRGRWLIGCDGANSHVRRLSGTHWQDLGFRQRWLVLDIDVPDAELDQWDGIQQLCDTTRPGTYMRIGDHRYRWEFRLGDHETAEGFSTLDSVLPLIRPWLESISPDDLDLVRSAEYTFRSCVADRWRTGRILLAGDAAHLTPPFIGQGLGSGQRDAANLAWKLAAVINGTAPASLLDSYEAERRPHATSLIRVAILLGQMMSGGGAVGDLLRRRGLGTVARVADRLPGLSRLTRDSATPPLPRTRPWEGTRITLPAVGHGASLAGHLIPNAPLTEPEATRQPAGRFDDHVGYRFSVVTTDPAGEEQAHEISRRGGVLLQVTPSSDLGTWLRDAGAAAAVVRPDRTVLTAGRSLTKVYNRLPPTRTPAKDIR